ncbi:hypothetical protein D3C75_1054730 [compost metagenome]
MPGLRRIQHHIGLHQRQPVGVHAVIHLVSHTPALVPVRLVARVATAETLPAKPRTLAVGQAVITPVQRPGHHPLPVTEQPVALQAGKPQPQKIQIVVGIAARPQVIQALIDSGADDTQTALFHLAPVALE